MGALDDLSGRQVGTVRVMQKIARGGIGTVYRGQHLKTRARVAVKVLNENLLGNKKSIQDFVNEYEIAKDFDNGALLHYYDAGEIAGAPYIVMDYFQGTPLRVLLQGEKRDDYVELAEAIIIQLATALDYMHNQGIVHRDLKTENVLVNEEGKVKLIDFSTSVRLNRGLTRIFQRSKGARTLDGTPSYMAPEQIRKEAPDTRSDIFSLGVIIFEMLAGRLPFAGGDVQETMNLILRKPAPSLAGVNARVCAGLDKLVASMLSKDPEKRPQDVRWFLHSFTRCGVFRS